MRQGNTGIKPIQKFIKKKKKKGYTRLAVFRLLQLFGRMKLQVTAEATMSCINDLRLHQDMLVFTLQKKCGRTTSEGA